MAKNKILNIEALSTDYGKIMEALGINASDLSIVITTAAFIDRYLGAILQNRFLQCSTADELLEKGALSNLSARAETAYCLELISKDQYKDIRTVLEIRNKFAHDYETTFDTPEVAALCNKLVLLRFVIERAKNRPEMTLITRELVNSMFDDCGQDVISDSLKMMEQYMESPRNHFRTVATMLCSSVPFERVKQFRESEAAKCSKDKPA